MGLVARKIGHPLSTNSNSILSAILSIQLLDYLHWYDTTFLWTKTEKRPLSRAKSSGIQRFESSIWLAFLFIVSWSTKRCRWTSTWPVKFSGVSFDVNNKSLTSSLSCNVLNPGKIFTRIPLNCRQFCPKLYIVMNFWTTSTCLPWQYLIVVSPSSFQDTIQNLKTRRPLFAEDEDLFITIQRQVLPWRIFPVNCFHSIDLVLFRHQIRRYVEHFSFVRSFVFLMECQLSE